MKNENPYKLYINSKYVTLTCSPSVQPHLTSEEIITAFDREKMAQVQHTHENNMKILNVNNQENTQMVPFMSILGFFKEDNNGYIVLVTEAEQVTEYQKIQHVTGYEIVQLSKEGTTDHFLKFLQDGLDMTEIYFSNIADISKSAQNQYKKPNETCLDFHLNKYSRQQLLDIWPASSPLTQTFIFGSVIERKPFVLISRRSIMNMGCHTWNRGSDKNGHTANFIENEYIYYDDDSLYSLVMIRGTIPLFWSQHPTGQKSRPIRYGTDREMKRRFDAHFDRLFQDYESKNIFIVALTENKGKEGVLTNLYQQHANNKDIRFFQISVTSLMYTPNVICEQIKPLVDHVDCFIMKNGEVLHTQESYVRANCTSSLGRTNLFLSILSHMYFNKLNIPVNDDVHTEMWNFQGDLTSLQYCCTLGQKKSMVLTGVQDATSKKNDKSTHKQRFYQSLTKEGSITDSLNVLSQENQIKKISYPGLFYRFFMLLVLLVTFSVHYLFHGEDHASLVWRKKIRNIINHPLYSDLRDADEYEDHEFGHYEI